MKSKHQNVDRVVSKYEKIDKFKSELEKKERKCNFNYSTNQNVKLCLNSDVKIHISQFLFS